MEEDEFEEFERQEQEAETIPAPVGKQPVKSKQPQKEVEKKRGPWVAGIIPEKLILINQETNEQIELEQHTTLDNKLGWAQLEAEKLNMLSLIITSSGYQ